MQPQHFGAPPYMSNGRIKSENGSERGVSPHPSDSSRYSSQQPQQPLPPYQAMPPQHMNGMRYPSPSQMQAPMPMLNNNNYIPQPPEHAYQQQQVQDPQQHQGGRPASDTGPPKAFACSTCGKGFARRSDLARHGMELGPQHQKARTDFIRTYPQWHSPPRVRLPQLRQAVHPAVRADCPPTRAHRREAAHVRAMWKGMTPSLDSSVPLLTPTSLSVTRVPSPGIVASIQESDHTSAHMPTARRHSRAAPL
jgi:hypothetical protein